MNNPILRSHFFYCTKPECLVTFGNLPNEGAKRIRNGFEVERGVLGHVVPILHHGLNPLQFLLHIKKSGLRRRVKTNFSSQYPYY